MLYIIAIMLMMIDIILYKNTKLRGILIIVNFVFMWIFLGWARGAYDVEIGINRYVNVNKYTEFTEPIFTMLVNLGHKMKINYRTFYAIIAFIELFALYKFINKYSDHTTLVLGLFIIFPMAYMFTLVRFLLAYCVVLCGGINILLEKKKGYELKYIIYVLLATLIHYSAVFFLLYLVVDKLNKKNTIRFVLVTMIILSSVTAFSGIVGLFSNYINAEKVNNILNNSVGKGILGRTVTAFVMFITYFIIYKLCDSMLENNNKWDKEKNFLVYKINLANLISIPLAIFYAIGFSRIFVVSLILYYISYSNMLNKISLCNINKKKFYAICMIIFCLLFELYFTYRSETMQEKSLRPMFEQNEFIRI